MFDDEDKSSKTEDASEHKLNKAKEEGNVPKSKEVNNFFALFAATLVVFLTMPPFLQSIMNIMGHSFQNAGKIRINQGTMDVLLAETSKEFFIAIAPVFGIFVLFALVGGLVQNGIIISAKPLEPKMSKISIIKGFGRMFSLKSVVELLKAIAKSTVVAAIMYAIAYYYKDTILVLADMEIQQDVLFVYYFLLKLLFALTVFLILIAMADFAYQKYNFAEDMKMSMKELKDEHKDTNGDPFVKSRQAQLRMEKARARMMQEVPNADVVITNPTHFAVALRYDPNKEPVPRVVAKGHDHIAQKIKEIAKENKVPIVENIELARTLWKTVDLDEIIPLDLYQAVADVIAYIMKLKAKK
ncbi:MAG TPA: flagellar biosynthesis protein FlhB [Alphaproteobacteria bacterium]|nr:flagellar biosynthesis protein FlhB [Alphaproteobacteria bacterium]